MNMLPLHSLIIQVDAWSDAPGGDPRQLGCNVEGEGTKVLDIHAVTGFEVVTQIFNKWSPDYEHLDKD